MITLKIQPVYSRLLGIDPKRLFQKVEKFTVLFMLQKHLQKFLIWERGDSYAGYVK